MIADYFKAQSVSEALQALEKNQPWGRIIAGGTDILQKTRATRHKRANPMVFIDIKRINELKGIHPVNDWLAIGPATTLDELIKNDLIQAHVPVLAQAASHVGSMEIRNRATVGGNIGTKSANADLLVPLIGLGARVEVTDLNGRREMPITELLAEGLEGLGRRLLITAIRVPAKQPVACGYQRWSKETMGRAYLGTMVSLEANDPGMYRVRVVFGGTGLWPRLFEADVPAEQVFNGGALIERVVEEKLGASRREDDFYRRQLLPVLIGEALDIAIKEGKL